MQINSAVSATILYMYSIPEGYADFSGSLHGIMINRNILDLSYQRHLQKFNALLIFLTTGIASFLGAFLSKPSEISFWIGLALGIIAVAGSFIYYWRTLSRDMENIFDELRALEKSVGAKK